MRGIGRYFRIEPVTSPGASAAVYLPAVIGARALSFVRLMLVARILGDAGQREVGLYRPALELINPFVALVLFGAADVVERYASRVERAEGGAGLGRWLRRQYLQMIGAGAAGIVLMTAAGRWIGPAIWGEPVGGLVFACAVTVLLLALFQYTGALLRGLRAYGAAAGMEVLSSILLIAFSVVAAYGGNAVTLVAAYAASIAIPLGIFGLLVRKHLRSANAIQGSAPTPAVSHGLSRFAAWSLVRLLLVMTFGFLSMWGVRFLSTHAATADAAHAEALRSTADYAMAFTTAQLLGTVAVTLWMSTYGIAARAWSHGQTRRARVQLFRMGKFGATAVTLAAVAILWGRGFFALLLPASYSDAIHTLLPGLLAMFIGYGLLAFFSTYGDLQEKPERGALLWAAAVAIQLGGILAGRFGGFTLEPRQYMLWVSATAIGAALFLLVPLILCRPVRLNRTAAPMLVLAVAPLTLFAPTELVNYVAGPALLIAVALLQASGLLLRPIDRRALRRRHARL